ncbi:hypothetical protein [Pseudomonas sp. SCA2728.1_7]|uniref:hypothetical protein n=1 Tax=Pseudomonas sp. SCA2728.1_7 TaxID=2825975 RepID=UPI001BAF5B6E|nr:hypothetical protein [Pseudomonas sp. SCA2728.1_7]QUE90451.1 hypothetical protein KBP52_28225 [Pseudomonas sp. SCA2728.1_7]
MSRPYSLTEDELHKLQRAKDSIQLLTILLEEVQRPNSLTPHMMASYLSLVDEDMSEVLQSISGNFSLR